MKPQLFSAEVWGELTRAVRASDEPCDVAVAYFGSGAAELLPLPEGSRLVVDASEAAVSAGQTSPWELLQLVQRGVQVFSMPGLHAKVFVLGSKAYVGSANVSQNSAEHLVECMVGVSEVSVVLQARNFVRAQCLQRLTPEFLEKLAKLYRPPKFPEGPPMTCRQKSKSDTALPVVRIVRLKQDTDWPEWDEERFEKDSRDAEALRQGPASYEVECFRWAGKSAFQRGQTVIQITETEEGHSLMSPPALVLKSVLRSKGKKVASYIYVEYPKRRRRSLEAVIRRLGEGAEEKLCRSGELKDAGFVRRLLEIWVD